MNNQLTIENVKTKKQHGLKGRLHEGSLNDRFIKGVRSGIRLTASQWAKKLNISKSHFSSIPNQIRKSGYLIYPVGGRKRAFGKGMTQGVWVDIMESQEHFNEVFNRSENNNIKPGMLQAFKNIELYAAKHPEEVKNLRRMAMSLYKGLLEIGEPVVESI